LGPVPFVTIAVPCLNEEAHIRRCLDDIVGQDYPGDRLEVLIADGGSEDGTREILSSVAAEDPRVRVLDNPGRIQATGLNAILRQARGEVIVRMDAHCEYSRDYVRRCIEVLQRTGADGVGGAQRATATTRFQRAVAAIFSSPLASGGARYRSPNEEGFVDTVFLGAYRRNVFEKVGLYDPGAVTNEDAELNERLVRAGGRIFLSREIVVHYHPRQTLSGLCRQYGRYGRGRARTLLKHRGILTFRPLVPFLFLLVAADFLVVRPLRHFAPWFFAFYGLAVLGESIRLSLRKEPALAPLIAVTVPAMHFSHGLGFGLGVLRYGLWPDWGPPELLPPRAA
jgi:glycosyltransferase involved in cell wall biosynthesis